MYATTTGANGNTRILYEYICDTEADIESLPTDKAPAKATCIGSGHVFYLVSVGGEFAYAGSDTAAKAATPVASVGAGAIVFPTNVTLSTTTPTAKIYYTTNGSTPTSGSTEYTEAIEVSSAITLKAIAIAEGYTNSEVASAIYTQAVVATPVADPAAGEVATDTEITLTCATVGAAIYYTVDGSTPNATKTLYSAESKPVISGALTVKAIGILAGYANSSVLTAGYTIV